MCGRFTQTSSRGLQTQFSLGKAPPVIPPEYNIAPTRTVPVVVAEEGERMLRPSRWGFDSKGPQKGVLNNARSETADQLFTFRGAFRSRRCIIPASGFFEWLRSGKEKLPYYFTHEGGDYLAFAGLWEETDRAEGPRTNFTILTTAANALMEPIHDRMPALLAPEEYDRWLDPDAPVGALKPLLRPYEGEGLIRFPVSKAVNSTRNDGPELIQPYEEPQPSLFADSPGETLNSK